jgi:hypothetical protein
MTNHVSRSFVAEGVCARAESLAERLEKGAQALATFASKLTDAQWRTRVPLARPTPVAMEGRSVGVIVHHVASVYPLEIELAQKLAAGQPITGVTMQDVDEMNAKHAKENSAVTKEAALELLARNSGVAAAAIRALSDESLAQAAPVSLYADAPLTCQFLLEDHAVRHSYHHLSAIKRALQTAGIPAMHV